MTGKTAWFCPACQKHHAPHCETCPAPVDAVSTNRKCFPLPPPVMPLTPCAPCSPDPTGAPWTTPYYPVVTSTVAFPVN